MKTTDHTEAVRAIVAQGMAGKIPAYITAKKIADTFPPATAGFPCECRGCRGYAADLDSVWDTRQIPNKVQGYYFSESTRRFFHSRINSFRRLAGGSLAVRESLAGDMNNETRVHRVTVWCRYGHLVNGDIADSTYSTGAKASTAMRALPDTAAAECDCHGCQLDRAGR